MKAFIWQSVAPLTGSWHNGGGCLVVANSLPRAEEILNEHREKNRIRGYDEDERFPLDPLQAPSLVLDLAGEHEERLMVFPDAGCC